MKACSTLLVAMLSVVFATACPQQEAPAEPPAQTAAPPAAAAAEAPAAGGHAPHGIQIIDSHVHIVPTMTALAQALEIFDRSGVTRFAAKSGGAPGEPRFQATRAMARVLGDRFAWFCNMDWDPIDSPNFPALAVRQLERCHAAGARGVKIFKALGLSVKTRDGKLVPVDDPRLDPLFQRAGELGMIMAMHTADPVAFFEPPTPQNERWDELKIAKSWSFYGDEFPSHDELLAQRDRLIARHPGTTFLLIHLANYPESLEYVDKLLATYPNVYVDTSARVPEFGRHPADKVRALFVKHQDRILFGSDIISTPRGMQLGSVWHGDTPPDIDDGVEFYRRHWEYFETNHAQIAHPTPIQGNWKVDAIELPPDVLKKLYHDNAAKLIWGDE